MRANSGRVVAVAGSECDPVIARWAAVLNARFGQRAARSLPGIRSEADARSAGDLASLAGAIARGEVRELFIFETNPAYTAAGDLDFAEKISRVPFTVHLGEHGDETAALCRWHLPAPHFLETWSDLRAYEGVGTIQQPLFDSLHATRSTGEILRLISSGAAATAYDLVRETWRGSLPSPEFERQWHRWLDRGVVDDSSPPAEPAADQLLEFPALSDPGAAHSLTLIFQPDPNVLDGRWANNAWLQELPKPLTHLVWDNAALISPQLAAERNLVNGDVVACEIGGASLEAPVWIMAGQDPSVIALSLGYGRTHAGTVGNGHGYDAYRLRRSAQPWQRSGVVLRKRERRHELVCTQGHFSMEGRELARSIPPAAAAETIDAGEPSNSLYPQWRGDRYAWGMSIDLSTCLGCNACILACQAENNIPVVGKDQVARGREMHWIRVDRYLSGDAANPRFLQQPVPCMHCENAPCEVVCPVGATVHSSEGLNDMVYNRCVGTRYCSNNCPYKVRRFNFLDYRAPVDSTIYLQANPNVTVRERGVMEKCTYCVQRINAGRIAAERENRAVRDGEIKTACQQACPAEAIVFGDLNDPDSRVVRRKAEPTNYALLAELNTRPRTTYLAAVRHDPLR